MENWYVVFTTLFMLWYSNYIIFDFRRVIIKRLSKKLRKQLKTYESVLKNQGFKLWASVRYVKRAIREDERFHMNGAVVRELKISILLKRKVMSESCKRVKMNMNKKKSTRRSKNSQSINKSGKLPRLSKPQLKITSNENTPLKVDRSEAGVIDVNNLEQSSS